MLPQGQAHMLHGGHIQFLPQPRDLALIDEHPFPRKSTGIQTRPAY
jgi:hypothetical protein